ncbi:MAG: RagB/SusD family nutrient uptake outer membrane protein, partial [Muribaculaceae bacterium]|nr:RagB/SusD family nutrient uptake outer membrane protein [Muribaculaceae bacterium]
MKKFIYAFAAVFGLLSLSACSEDSLNTEPTDSMSGTTLLSDGTRALVPLNGIYRSMYTAGWSTEGNTHQCFGISAYNLMAEVMGDDFVMGAQGSGWFYFDARYNVKTRFTQSTWRSYDLWNAYYTWISNANYIIAAEESMGGSTQAKNYAIGQAYAIRGYSYFMLAQSFARTYKGHESEPCVPIYTGPTFTTTTGQPRSTVAEVYKQIDDDLNKAVELLKGT